jgi:hypothetical protein
VVFVFEFRGLLVDVGEGACLFAVGAAVGDADGEVEWGGDEATVVVVRAGFYVGVVARVEDGEERLPDAAGHDGFLDVLAVKCSVAGDRERVSNPRNRSECYSSMR